MQSNAKTVRPVRGAKTLMQDAEALHGALSDLVRIYQYRDRDRICCHDISVTQCHALEALVGHGPMRAQELARRLMLDKSTTTRVVDALERKGYVERTPAPDDARALSLVVTRSGRALHDRISRELVAQQAALLADVDPALRADVIAVIRRLAQAAQARFVDGAAACGTDGGIASAGCG